MGAPPQSLYDLTYLPLFSSLLCSFFYPTRSTHSFIVDDIRRAPLAYPGTLPAPNPQHTVLEQLPGPLSPLQIFSSVLLHGLSMTSYFPANARSPLITRRLFTLVVFWGLEHGDWGTRRLEADMRRLEPLHN